MPAPAENPPTTSRLAVASLAAAALGFCCLPGIGGVLAIALGIGAKSEIERSHGEIGGLNTARAGALLGALNLLLLAAWVLTASFSSPKPAVAVTARPSLPLAPPPSSAPSVAAPVPDPGTLKMSRDDGIVETHIGAIDLVDVGARIQSLTQALDDQRRTAQRLNQRLLFWLVLPGCQPCNGVAAALPDPRMQRALAGVRLVRLDLTEFGRELGHLGVPVARADGTVLVPAFVLLDERNRPTDYVHGGEWDADIAPNIAPVLGDFMRGRYKQRRHPWQLGHTDDGIPL